MPMIVPHQSQAGIATGNAGQAAPYRSASAFVTPGQAAMPNGLNQLARGMDKLGDALAKYGLDRLKMQNATDLLADKIAYEDALRDFDSNYRQTHQGVSARDAEEAYGQFHKEQYDKLQQKWGGNPFLMQGVDRMVEGIRQPSMQRAVAYRDSEEDAYQKSVLASSQAQTFQTFADPSRSWQEKEAALQAEENNLRMFAGQRPVMVDGRIQWQGGKDVTAQVMALRQRLEAEHVNGLIATNQLDAARAFLGGGAGGYSGMGSLAVGHESGGDPGNISRDTSGSKSYGLFQFNNMGGKGTANTFMSGLKATHPKLYEALGGGKYAVGSAEFDKAFKETAGGPMRGEMVQAQQEHFAASYKAPIEEKLKGSAVHAALGGNKAFQEVMLSTAIQHGPGGANRILREAWGMVDKNTAPQAQLEQFITTTYQLRGRPGEFKTALSEQKDDAARQRFMDGLRGRFSREATQALALARGEASGGPQSSSLSAAARAQFSMHIDAMERRNELAAKQAEKEAKSKAADDAYNSIHAAVQGLPPQEQEARAASFIAAIPDPDMRKSMLSRLKDDIAVESMRQKATDYEQGRKYRELVQTQGLLPSQALAGVDSIQGMSDEGREKLRASLNKEAQKATPQNTQALNDLLRQIDTGAIAEDTAIDSYAFDKSLTDKQVKQAKEYLQKGGNKGGVSFSRVERIYKRMGKGKTMPPDVFELVLQNIEPGKPATDERLQQTLANLYMEGESIGSGWWWDKDETYADALEQGRGDTWLPDVTEAEKKAITAVLRQAGIIVTDERIRKYKKYELMRIGAGR